MKVIIAGGRNITDQSQIDMAVASSGFTVTELISGTARGADRLGEAWARDHQVPVTRFPAEWDRYGKRAGYLRNQIMAQYAEALILVWDGQSAGSGHMLAIAKALGLKVFEFIVGDPDEEN